jgi:hypothetical protein
MATNYPCAFTVTAGTAGGKLIGGFAGGARPTLQNGDSITVSVSFAAGDPNAPVNLNGYFVFTAASDASNQSTPSPFLNGSSQNFICLAGGNFSSAVAQGNSLVYTFQPWTYRGGKKGSYELTFVASNDTGSAQGTPMQWSEDPEFETGN